MQTILGAGGVIGNELVNLLPKYTDKIRVVSRNPKQADARIETVSADLFDLKQTNKAVEGSDVVYLTAGFKYDAAFWQTHWPLVMNNVIEACEKHGARLVFLDNVYMLGKVDGWMKEDTPVNPCSKKGEVRAKIAQTLLDEINKKSIQAIIARSADFYGPGAANSVFNMLVFKNFSNNKKAAWLCNDSVKHSFSYTPDVANGLALLGNKAEAYNQIWHLPTDQNALTGKELIQLAANAFGRKPVYTVLKKWMVKAAGIFNPVVGESVEMLYQSQFPYLFDSSKFEKYFNYSPVVYRGGVGQTYKSYLS